MGSMLVIPVENNIVAGAALSSSPTADALFPLTNLADQRVNKAFRFSGTQTDPYIIIDKAGSGGVLVNGGIDTWYMGLPNRPDPGWVVLPGGYPGFIREGTVVHGGAYSASGLLGSVLAGRLGQYTYLQAGQAYRVSAAFYQTAIYAPGVVQAYLYNTNLNQYLKPDGTWQTARIAWATSAPYIGAWSVPGVNFTVPDLVTGGAAAYLYLLSFEMPTDETPAGQIGYWDSASIDPLVNCLSVHGHNIPFGTLVEVADSASGSGPWTVRGSTVASRDSFYVLLVNASQRYLKFTIKGATGITYYIGELVAGSYFTLPGPKALKFSRRSPQVRGQIGVWGSYAYGYGDGIALAARIRFPLLKESDALMVREVIFYSAREGKNIVIVPDTTGPEVLYGRVLSDWNDERISRYVRGVEEFAVESAALPILVSA